MLLTVFAAALAAAAPSGPVVEARIADVISDPERFGGQTLRLRGQVDSCFSWVCSICPEEMTSRTADPAGCLRISFDDFDPVDEGPSEDRWFSAGVGREMERAFRFTVVTAEGEFDPSCLTGRPGPLETAIPDGEEVMIVCTDRASTWRGVQVRAVHRRLPSNDGLLFDARRDDPLNPAPAQIAAATERAYREYVLTFDDDPQWEAVAVFQTAAPLLDDPDREAWACVCRVDDCSGAWPKREISLWASTSNDPYACHFALERDGVWRLYPE